MSGPGDAWQAAAQYALERCVVDPPYDIPAHLRALAQDVIIALMKAGLPIFDFEADAEEHSTGVQLAVPDGPGLRVVWRQHPILEGSALWHTQQAALHQALRKVLVACGFRLADEADPGAAPTVLGAALAAAVSATAGRR